MSELDVTLRLRVHSTAEVEAALEGLAQVAQVQLSHLRLPPLYAAGVHYQREDGTEKWLGPLDVYAAGVGDCEDLVAWRVAELRMSGERANPLCYEPRPGLVHCVVRREDGQIEDPSRLLGM